tara:strand:+ start:80 stop:1498 length:1419 start_codon:yes stop_codon:yes gene_type:complete
MGSTYTDNGGIELIGLGEQAGAWGTTTNNNFDIIDRLINGVKEITLSGDGSSAHTLTTSDGSLSDGMFKVIIFKGSPSGSFAVTIDPEGADKLYFVKNECGQTVFMRQGTHSSSGVASTEVARAVEIPNGDSAIVFADGGGASATVKSLSVSLVAKGLSTSSGDITLDSAGDIDLDADGGDVKISDGGTEILRITNSSNDVIIKPIQDEKDIIFQQRDGTEVARIEDNGTFNVVTGKLAINADPVTATADELNLLDGGTSVGSSITVADADGVVVNDGGTMKSVPASDFRTYIMPAGSVIPYAGTSAPTGFLLCDGSAVSRSTYAALFGVIGETYGAGDGSSTFALPDLRGRIVAGKDDMGGSAASKLTNQSGGVDGDALGAKGGSETQALVEANLPAHTHTFSDTDSHTVSFPRTFISGAANNSVNVDGSGQRHDGGTLTVSISGTTSSTGSDSAHNNVQPTIILNYIIRI